MVYVIQQDTKIVIICMYVILIFEKLMKKKLPTTLV